jgi:hypothetical protein
VGAKWAVCARARVRRGFAGGRQGAVAAPVLKLTRITRVSPPPPPLPACLPAGQVVGLDMPNYAFLPQLQCGYWDLVSVCVCVCVCV